MAFFPVWFLFCWSREGTIAVGVSAHSPARQPWLQLSCFPALSSPSPLALFLARHLQSVPRSGQPTSHLRCFPRAGKGLSLPPRLEEVFRRTDLPSSAISDSHCPGEKVLPFWPSHLWQRCVLCCRGVHEAPCVQRGAARVVPSHELGLTVTQPGLSS